MPDTPDLLARLIALQETTNARLDRQDATLAGISLTLVQLQGTLETQTTVLARFEAVLMDHAQVLREIATALKALVPPQPNGREA